MTLFASDTVYASILEGLRGLGYGQQGLLSENYAFADWFSPNRTDRRAAAVAFGQTPTSYDTALIGVVFANGVRGPELIDQYRALGAPFILEIEQTTTREWAVALGQGKHSCIKEYPSKSIRELFVNRAHDWKPESLMRAKNIGAFTWTRQLSLFAGLVPELEEQIQENLDPLLQETLARTQEAYKSSTGKLPDPTQLFRLVFSLLTAKVFRDRGVPEFLAVSPDPDDLIAAVAKRHKTTTPRFLNRFAREAAASLVWDKLDFRNLSVEVLSQIWASTLVDDETKERLGIHRTSRTIVRYIMERIRFEQAGDDQRIVLEPCSGSGVFLVGAMNALRHRLFGFSQEERHDYFVSHLAGIEKDPFGAEISRLSLTLADFPNPNDWDISQQDVFKDGALEPYLKRTGVVLCNPPFRDFDDEERDGYKWKSPKKPVELLNRILDHLHPSGVLGFVLPRQAVDGRGGYAEIRKRLAERYERIDIAVLPDRAFEADPEVALVVATEPIPHDRSKLTYVRVRDRADAWQNFEHTHEVSFKIETEITPEQGTASFAVPELPDVWDFLVNHNRLGEIAELHRGIEWKKRLTFDGEETGYRKEVIRTTRANGFRIGVPPKAKFFMFECPDTRYLDMRPATQRGNAYKHPWSKPKAILNKSTTSRGRWRLSAFADSVGLVCYQTFTAAWPVDGVGYDEILIAAILNAPIANAFVATREGKTDNSTETLKAIPIPSFTTMQARQLRKLVSEYQESMYSETAGDILMKIDAAVLDAYQLPPRLERKILDFFHGESRKVPTRFADYPTWEQDVFFPLSFYLSGRFESATAIATLKRLAL